MGKGKLRVIWLESFNYIKSFYKGSDNWLFSGCTGNKTNLMVLNYKEDLVGYEENDSMYEGN